MLLWVGAVVAVFTVTLLIRRDPPAPAPRIALLAQYEAGLLALIRERYQCTDAAARDVRRRYAEWQMDAIGEPVQIRKDGKLLLSNDTVDTIDRYALKIGLRPVPKGEGAA